MSATHVSQSDTLLWLIDGRKLADDQLRRCICWLNPEELARYDRFIRPQRQRQFLIGRSLLRAALGTLLKVAPMHISLSERVGNAPVLNWPTSVPFFSISHSGPWVACLVSENIAMGLDIEMKNPDRDLDALAAHAFDQAEMAQFSKLTGQEERLNCFYELWSYKEARYKLHSNIDLNNMSKNLDHCIVFAHPELSVVLCSQDLLTVPLPLVEVNFSTLISD